MNSWEPWIDTEGLKYGTEHCTCVHDDCVVKTPGCSDEWWITPSCPLHGSKGAKHDSGELR